MLAAAVHETAADLDVASVASHYESPDVLEEPLSEVYVSPGDSDSLSSGGVLDDDVHYVLDD